MIYDGDDDMGFMVGRALGSSFSRTFGVWDLVKSSGTPALLYCTVHINKIRLQKHV